MNLNARQFCTRNTRALPEVEQLTDYAMTCQETAIREAIRLENPAQAAAARLLAEQWRSLIYTRLQ